MNTKMIIRLLYQAGQLLFKDRADYNPEQALVFYAQVLQFEPDNRRALDECARLLQSLGRHPEARPHLQKMYSGYPGLHERIRLAECLHSMERQAEALGLLADQPFTVPGHMDGLVLRENLFREYGDAEAAESDRRQLEEYRSRLTEESQNPDHPLNF
jgi:tetratricopeptide (TPR) repeat protein